MTVRQGLVAIVVAGGVLRFVPIWFGLPYMQARPDEETAIGHAAAVLGGDLNPHFFHWPSFTFYALAAIFALASWIRGALSIDPALTPQHYVLISRAFVAAAGTLTLVAVFRIGRRTAGNTVGLLAALFLAVSILHVRESHFAMTDVLMTLFVTLSLAMLLRGVDADAEMPADMAPHVRWFAGAGLMAGLATSTKYSAAAVVVSMAVAQLLLLARRRATRSLWSPSAWLPAAAFLTVFAVAFVAGTPYAVLDYEHFASDVEFTVSHLAGGHAGDLGRGWIYHLRRSLPYGAGIATFIAAIVGIVPLARHYRVHALVLGGFAGRSISRSAAAAPFSSGMRCLSFPCCASPRP